MTGIPKSESEFRFTTKNVFQFSDFFSAENFRNSDIGSGIPISEAEFRIPPLPGIGILNWNSQARTWELEWWCNVMVESQPPVKCIPHPCYVKYKQCVWAPWYAVDGGMGPPVYCYGTAGWGVVFQDFGGIDLSPSLSDDEMSWSRLKPPVECIQLCIQSVLAPMLWMGIWVYP